MPLIRRIPKRGFTNPFKQPAQVVNVRHLVLLAEGVEVTPETLFGAGLVRRPDHPIKLLGTGDVSGRKFVVKGVAVAPGAHKQIEKARGTIARGIRYPTCLRTPNATENAFSPFCCSAAFPSPYLTPRPLATSA